MALLAALIAGAIVPVAAQDWPQWRGPNRDGAVAPVSAPKSWPERLQRQWQVEVGLGYATPLLVGRRYKVAGSDTWTEPTISGNRVYVKDVSTLTLWTLN